jgi:hypothetical protein
VAITHYTRVGWDDPEVKVCLTYAGQVCAGFVDDRPQRDGVWEARIYYSYIGEDGLPHRRYDWSMYNGLELKTPAASITPSAGTPE